MTFDQWFNELSQIVDDSSYLDFRCELFYDLGFSPFQASLRLFEKDSKNDSIAID